MNSTEPVPAFPWFPGNASQSEPGNSPGMSWGSMPWLAGAWGANPWVEYGVDAWQRTVLFLDTLRLRGNAFLEHEEDAMRNVLTFAFDLVVDGRSLGRPVNYWLARIHPPEGAPPTNRRLRPFVIVDPRAGHGAGIGGFKADSEIGCAITAGHPCYFVGFRTEPEPRQTLEDVLHAVVHFVETTGRLHDDAEGKPVVIGNCQGGWTVLIAAAIRPEAFGPIIVAGAPVSYWAGTEGFAPMRYLGGLLGGSWMTALTSDIGGGKFNGAWLVTNFENNNPANTWWTKQYNVWSKVDTEAQRYLGFERYWGGHVLMNAEEMQFIVDQLFIGNRLATAELTLSDGTRIDLRSITSPIVVFCSRGDNITPPAQALSWISDLYTDNRDLQSHQQTIIYAVHEEIGHLGIFVSGAVARKEHREFASNIDLIDVLPPGLYQATLRDKAGLPRTELIETDYVLSFEPRAFQDLSVFGSTSAEDERRFAAVRRVSDINLGLYRATLGAALKHMANPTVAEALRELHPARLSYIAFSDRNPAMQAIATLAQQVRGNRRAVPDDNPGRAAERQMSDAITRVLEGYGTTRDALAERLFQALYDSPAVQVLTGVAGSAAPPRARPGNTAEHRRFVEQAVAELERRRSVGGVVEAVVRAILYAGAEGNADERVFATLRRIREQVGREKLSLMQFKAVLREQFFMLMLDEQGALAALPALLPKDEAERRTAYEIVRTVTMATGETTAAALARLKALAPAFGVEPEALPAYPTITAAAVPDAVASAASRGVAATLGKKQ